ncbi:unnamed protein product [marine sediment metagenome]|uniref:Uncharacterized protein n=1 Tax=marine sediment metagenome TaxID=412755 RepID=X0X1S5_9ZZZZ
MLTNKQRFDLKRGNRVSPVDDAREAAHKQAVKDKAERAKNVDGVPRADGFDAAAIKAAQAGIYDTVPKPEGHTTSPSKAEKKARKMESNPDA